MEESTDPFLWNSRQSPTQSRIKERIQRLEDLIYFKSLGDPEKQKESRFVSTWDCY